MCTNKPNYRITENIFPSSFFLMIDFLMSLLMSFRHTESQKIYKTAADSVSYVRHVEHKNEMHHNQQPLCAALWRALRECRAKLFCCDCRTYYKCTYREIFCWRFLHEIINTEIDKNNARMRIWWKMKSEESCAVGTRFSQSRVAVSTAALYNKQKNVQSFCELFCYGKIAYLFYISYILQS